MKLTLLNVSEYWEMWAIEPDGPLKFQSALTRTLWAKDEKNRLYSTNLDCYGSPSPWQLRSQVIGLNVEDDVKEAG